MTLGNPGEKGTGSCERAGALTQRESDFTNTVDHHHFVPRISAGDVNIFAPHKAYSNLREAG